MEVTATPRIQEAKTVPGTAKATVDDEVTLRRFELTDVDRWTP